MKSHEKEEPNNGNCSHVSQGKYHFSSHKKFCVDLPVEFLPIFWSLNDFSSNNNKELEQGDMEHEADNSTEESINIESRLFHEDTVETINEEIETVEESNDERKIEELEKESELRFIIRMR